MSRSPINLVIAGGGMIGLSLAYEAVSRGIRVTVLERDRIGHGAGHAAAGMLAPASEADAGDRDLTVLALESCRLYPDFVARVERDSGLSCGYRREGSLLVALNRDHVEELERLAAFQERLGLHVELLSSAEILDREPAISTRAIGGLFAADDRQVDPRRLQRALATALSRLGGTIIENSRVLGVRTSQGKVEGVTCAMDGGERELPADRLILSAGAWTPALPLMAARVLPIRPVKGQILRLRGAPLVSHVLRTPDVYMVPREDGELVIGATAEEMGFDGRPTAGAAFELLRDAFRVLPGIAELELAEHTVGFRPALRDALPAIGPAASGGIFVATGHYRHGVMLAPATAVLLIDWICSGQGSPLLAPFDPSRFVTIPSTVNGGVI